ncbi:hypothetical protein GCM10010404_39550 [Nonomuraea africana]
MEALREIHRAESARLLGVRPDKALLELAGGPVPGSARDIRLPAAPPGVDHLGVDVDERLQEVIPVRAGAGRYQHLLIVPEHRRVELLASLASRR